MYRKDDSAPCGASEDARLEGGSTAKDVALASSAAAPPSGSTPVEPCGAPESDAQTPADAPALPSTSGGFGEIEQMERVAFFDQIEKTPNLGDRAFQLRIGRFKPYDKRTRNLVMSVKNEGPLGAFVQHLLQTPQPMPASILKPVRLPRPQKLKRLRSPKSLYETLLGGDDEAA